MGFFTNLVVSTAIALIVSYGLVNYAPLSWFSNVTHHTFGTTVTTIQGSDTISGSRTTINNNFTNLNNGKIENSTTSLPKLVGLGTITTGVWNATAVTAAFGGTGSTTLSTNQIILGNGTGIVNVVNGFGTVGQNLTSNGSAVPPSWQSNTLDTTLNYNWTGTNLFKSLNASSTVVIGSITYVFPSAQATATSTVLANDGNGNLTWSTQGDTVLYQNTNVQANTGNTSTTTLATAKIPAGFISTTNRSLRITGMWQANGGTCWGDIEYGSGSATSTIAFGQLPNNASPHGAQITATLYPQTSASQYTTSFGTFSGYAGDVPSTMQAWSASSSVNAANISYIGFAAKAQSGIQCTFIGGTVQLLSA